MDKQTEKEGFRTLAELLSMLLKKYGRERKEVIKKSKLDNIYAYQIFAGKKNPDLWMRFLRVYRRHHVRFIWVKGHASTAENNRCDELAVAAANSGNLMEDTGYNPE